MAVRFTLVELMIVVGIIAVLGAIAIPAFYRYQLDSKRSEIVVNVDGIGRAQMAYEAANDEWVNILVQNPGGPPGKTKRAWVTGRPEWEELGWAPDGDVYGNYASQVGGLCPASTFNSGSANLDGDALMQEHGCCTSDEVLTGAWAVQDAGCGWFRPLDTY